jgi:hypothetical protein
MCRCGCGQRCACGGSPEQHRLGRPVDDYAALVSGGKVTGGLGAVHPPPGRVRCGRHADESGQRCVLASGHFGAPVFGS